MKIAVIGAGYVGLSTALNMAELGHEVHCCEVSEERLALLTAGRSPIGEPGIQEALQRALQEGSLQLHGDIRSAAHESELLFIAVTTVEQYNAPLLAVAQVAIEVLPAGAVIAIKSTVPPGTCALLQKQIRKTDKPVYVAFCPEFLRQGHALEECRRPSRIVVGTEDEVAREVLHKAYAPLLERNRSAGREPPMIFCRPSSAELSKLTSNLLLAARISIINEVADLCGRTGGDIDEVAGIAGMDARIGSDYLRAGPGFGGSCLPKDGRMLSVASAEVGLQSIAIDAVVHSNEDRIERLPSQLQQLRAEVGATGAVAVWGLSFKADTDDLRHSTALSTVTRLAEAGLSLQVYDALARHELLPAGVRREKDPLSAARGASMLLVLTDSQALAAVDVQALHEAMVAPRLIYDAVRLFDGAVMHAAGLDYRALGRG